MSRRKKKPTRRVKVPIEKLNAIVERTRTEPLARRRTTPPSRPRWTPWRV